MYTTKQQKSKQSRVIQSYNNCKNIIQYYVKRIYTRKEVDLSDIKEAIINGLKQNSIQKVGVENMLNKTNDGLTMFGRNIAERLYNIYKYRESIRLVLSNQNSFENQIAQDTNLLLNNEDNLVGIPHQHSEFSRELDKRRFGIVGSAKKGRMGANDTRIYRCMSLKDWDNGVLRGHGGSFGEALHYFRLSKKNFNNDANNSTVLVEFRIWNHKLNDLIDGISSKGEGTNTTETKFGGKTEKNVAFGVTDVFSVSMTNSKKLLSTLKATSRVVDYVGDEPSVYRKSANKWGDII